MPYLGIGSISGIIHIMARFPHAARAVVVVAVRAADADDARRVLAEDDASPGDSTTEP